MLEYLDQLRANIINLKSLDQDISDPIIAGTGEVGGPQLYVILTQEAAARFTPITNLYLSWKHLDYPNVRGYDMFEKVSDKPAAWAINWPNAMRRAGTVEACLEIVDAQSISQSRHFNINVLSDIESGVEDFLQEDYDLFHRMLVEMNLKLEDANKLVDNANDIVEITTELYNTMKDQYDNILDRVDKEEELFKQLQEEWQKFLMYFSKSIFATKCEIDCYVFEEKDACDCDSSDPKEFGYLKLKRNNKP